jgi:hypothetical protein
MAQVSDFMFSSFFWKMQKTAQLICLVFGYAHPYLHIRNVTFGYYLSKHEHGGVAPIHVQCARFTHM